MVNAYQGLLPTYLYAFQFPVSTPDRASTTPLFSPTLAILTGGDRRDLPGRGLLGLGLAAGARRVGEAAAGAGGRCDGEPAGPTGAGGLARSGGA